mmetsp:Transcript_115902/g.266087  ORF Transcript_115902/g.266087 Transcript_115902/m.266087 type:complete len:409 (-) Transcript_115902:179-1405(-)
MSFVGGQQWQPDIKVVCYVVLHALLAAFAAASVIFVLRGGGSNLGRRCAGGVVCLLYCMACIIPLMLFTREHHYTLDVFVQVLYSSQFILLFVQHMTVIGVWRHALRVTNWTSVPFETMQGQGQLLLTVVVIYFTIMFLGLLGTGAERRICLMRSIGALANSILSAVLLHQFAKLILLLRSPWTGHGLHDGGRAVQQLQAAFQGFVHLCLVTLGTTLVDLGILLYSGISMMIESAPQCPIVVTRLSWVQALLAFSMFAGVAIHTVYGAVFPMLLVKIHVRAEKKEPTPCTSTTVTATTPPWAGGSCSTTSHRPSDDRGQFGIGDPARSPGSAGVGVETFYKIFTGLDDFESRSRGDACSDGGMSRSPRFSQPDMQRQSPRSGRPEHPLLTPPEEPSTSLELDADHGAV